MPWSRLGHTPDLPPLHIPTAKIGRQHPDRVVETSTLSSVPPPDITYTLALPSSDSGALSALQLEAITYAHACTNSGSLKCHLPSPFRLLHTVFPP